ncbi:hypothetical protein [Nonlabens spongiae]|uniref:hypothetical protein n=1 Tax=Nonlabens spongiae TaxID=331648 RepID=UPI0012F4FB50|nr:hypothetical protein [Nonlabens spongiae]
MNFLKFLLLCLIAALLVIGYGFYEVENGDPASGHKYIGMATLFIFFVIMPLFIWNRYSKKDLSGFTFNNSKMDNDDEDDDWDGPIQRN